MFDYSFLDEMMPFETDGLKLKTCIQCGSCSGGCPAAGGMAATPRKLWRMAQMGMQEEILSAQSFWNCTTCELCNIRCPRGISLASIMLKFREYSTTKMGSLKAMEKLQTILESNKNITGDKQESRTLWIENLRLPKEELEKIQKRSSDVVLFTGCVSSLFPQANKIPQSLTMILHKLGENFALLGEKEYCCGYPLLAAGLGVEAIREYALHNLEAVKEKGGQTVLITCPTCYHIWEKVYPHLLGDKMDLKVVHYSQYMAGVLAKGLAFNQEEVLVTYHDPCDLGRKSHVMEEPRQILKMIPGVKLVEMRFNREQAKCCGGGGNMEMLNPDLSLEIAVKRLEEAMDTGAQYLLTSCQQCKRTLMNAARKTRSRIKINDILEFIADRMQAQDGGER